MNHQYLRVLIILSLLTGNLACTNTPPIDSVKSPSPSVTNIEPIWYLSGSSKC